MLITSGQVSVAFSSAIVFFFTTALFLSGYVLQQATLRDLRAAIKPQLHRPSPGADLHLPQSSQEGYLVDMVKIETQPIRDDVGGEPAGKESTGRKGSEESNAEEDEQATKDTSQDMVGATRWQKTTRRKTTQDERSRQAASLQRPNVDSNAAQAPGEERVTKSQPEPKPMSAAERRRRIKEQIVSEGEGEVFRGYRRRMW
ncbi:unnamed protein product [Diplocarpon coronariae]|uniref:Uncharacterized protein n=1 Tax=Diplocarpon coronariae TaxID=2795749 RepID=A0A218Z5Q3_9HELO|nr:hypothetical protein JHW43_004472 [Diplocarpon mali]OWP03092.1 hypothetical protein B2J93_6409 [Marssonina coronariae]